MQPASGNPGPCGDPWVSQAVRLVAKRAANGSGSQGECNPDHYARRTARGHWSSYNDLVNKVRAKLTRQGAVYIFVNPTQALLQGHIGWGYLDDDGTYVFGSTENPMKEGAQGWWDAVYVPAGGDNGWWAARASTEQEMLDTMKSTGYTATGKVRAAYAEWKTTMVSERNPSRAWATAAATKGWGFTGVGNNCLDHTYAVLEAYNVNKSVIMPWKQTHPAPNSWFRAFGYQDPNSMQMFKGADRPGNRL